MEFKVFLLCFAVLVAATSAATVCKCQDKKDTMSKYNVKIKDGNVEIDEKVEIDTEKQTETLTVPKANTGKNGNEGEVKVVFDFKKNLTMHRLSAAKTCFLSESTENVPKPDDLLKILEYEQVSSVDTAVFIAINVGFGAVAAAVEYIYGSRNVGTKRASGRTALCRFE